MKLIKNNLLLLIVIIFSIPLILPYFHAGYFPTHDGEWAVVRLGDMFRELRDFQIPPRYSGALNFGYGYPLFNFTYPFPYYLGVLIHLLRFNFVNSIKLLFTLSVPFSGIGMFLASKEIWKNKWAGFVSAILYMYLPYRMVDLYVRGSIGESLSLALFPFIFYFAIRSLEKKNWISTVISGLLFGSLVMTHNIMAVLFTPVLIVLLIVYAWVNKENIINILWLLIIGVLISAFFWMPALLEKNNILLSKIPIADRNLYFVHLDQLIIPSWNYGVPDQPNGFSYQLGIGQLLAFVIAIILLVKSWTNKKIEKPTKFAVTIFAITFVSILLMFSFSAVVWKLPLLKEINYPWTLLAVVGFLISLFAGFVSSQNNLLRNISLALCLLSIIFVFPYAKPKEYVDRGDTFYLTNPATTTSSDELMPLWVKDFPKTQVGNKTEIISGTGSISFLTYNSKRISFDAQLKEDSTIRINTIYYSGWNIRADYQPVQVSYTNDRGVMDIKLSKGNHLVQGNFTETPLRLIADGITLLTGAALFVGTIFALLKRKA